MNAEIETSDRTLAVEFLSTIVESADDVPIMISLRLREGNYVVTVAHPEFLEPSTI
jgi:hypothetical protein